jgi:hypothetical protein
MMASLLLLSSSTIGELWTERYAIFSEARPIEILSGFAVALAGLSIIGWALKQLARDLGCGIETRKRRLAEARARTLYGSLDRWRAVWHPDDEPIALLSATMLEPPELLPRGGEYSGDASRNQGKVPWYWRYSGPITKAGDQFTWSVIMSKAQGSDIEGLRMVACGPAPDMLFPWPPLPDSQERALSDSADNAASKTIARIRHAAQELAKTPNGGRALATLGALIKWDELIHTSYFAQPTIVALIIDHIKQFSNHEIELAYEVAPGIWRPFLEWNLAAVKTISAILILFTMAFIADTLFDRGIGHYLVSRQIQAAEQRILEGIARPVLLITGAGFNQSVVGDVIARLQLLGLLKPGADTVKAIANIPQEDDRSQAAQRVAYHLAYRHLSREAGDLAEAIKPSLPTRADVSAPLIRLQAVVGAAQGGDNTKLTPDMLRQLHQLAAVEVWSVEILSELLTLALKSGQIDQALKDLDWAKILNLRSPPPQDQCIAVREPAMRLSGAGDLDHALLLIEACSDESLKLGLIRLLAEEATALQTIPIERIRSMWTKARPDGLWPAPATRAAVMLHLSRADDFVGDIPSALQDYRKAARAILQSGAILPDIRQPISIYDDQIIVRVIAANRNDILKLIENNHIDEFDRSVHFYNPNIATIGNPLGLSQELVRYFMRFNREQQANQWCQDLEQRTSLQRPVRELPVLVTAAGTCWASMRNEARSTVLLERAHSKINDLENSDDRLVLVTAIIEAVPRSHDQLARAWIAAAIPYLDSTRGDVLRFNAIHAFAGRLAAMGDFDAAMRIADRATAPNMTLHAWTNVLDEIINRKTGKDPSTFGFGNSFVTPAIVIADRPQTRTP